MEAKNKIIYISSGTSTFVLRDIKFLSKTHSTVSLLYSWTPKIKTPLFFLRQAIDLIKHINSSRAIIVMFGGYWSFLPSLFGRVFNKPVYIILGGTDCVSFPSYHYGSLRKPVLRTFIKWSYQLCERLLPVDQSLVQSDYSYDDDTQYPKQGFRFFFPSIKTPYTVINNGFDIDFWKREPALEKKAGTFITVASVTDTTRFYIKGIDLVCALADKYPEMHFTIVGINKEMQKTHIPNLGNLECIEFLSPFELRKQLSTHEFYLQLSISEGFPNALCEAMLCECIPVGSMTGAIPFIINDIERIVAKRDIRILQDKIESLFTISPEHRAMIGRRSRKRIAQEFPITKREREFIRLIEGNIV